MIHPSEQGTQMGLLEQARANRDVINISDLKLDGPSTSVANAQLTEFNQSEPRSNDALTSTELALLVATEQNQDQFTAATDQDHATSEEVLLCSESSQLMQGDQELPLQEQPDVSLSSPYSQDPFLIDAHSPLAWSIALHCHYQEGCTGLAVRPSNIRHRGWRTCHRVSLKFGVIISHKSIFKRIERTCTTCILRREQTIHSVGSPLHFTQMGLKSVFHTS
jgi:hypothetical protein